MKTASVTAALMVLFAFDCSYGCTTLLTVGEGGVHAGFNLDYSNYHPKVWFVPSDGERYGRYCFGFDEDYRTAEGGMNEKGLFIAVNALNEDAGWRPDTNLPDWEEWQGWFGTGVPDGILAKCATVDEAVRVFEGYNLFTLNRVKFLIADRSGASTVVEWSTDGLAFAERNAPYQISTNFVASNHAAGQYPCGRYAAAERVLGSGRSGSPVDRLRAALSAAHLEFQTPTVFSNICNLETGDILIYYFHNYEEVVKLNLFDELGRGGARYKVDSLFDVEPYVAEVYKTFSK